MTHYPPRWVAERYAILYQKCKLQPFTRREAVDALKKGGISIEPQITNVFFSDLAKLGWVIITPDKDDKRKNVYRLIDPRKGFSELVMDKD